MTALSLFPFDGSLPGWWLAVYFGGVLLVPLAVIAGIGLKLTGQRRRLTAYEPLAAAAIPADLIRCGQPWLGRLAYLGFPVVQVVQPKDDAGPESVTWQLASAKDKAVGVLTGTLPAGGGKPSFSLTLFTFLSDGRVIVTADQPLTHRPPANWSLVRQGFTMLESQVQEHRAHVVNRSGGVAAVMPTHAGQIAARLGEEDKAVFEALIASHDYAPAGEGVIRPALSRLPLLACRGFGGLFTGAAFPPRRRKDVASVSKSSTPGEEEIGPSGDSMTLSLEEMVEQDVRRFRKHADEPAGKKHLFLRIAILVATLIFFTATFGREAPLTTVGILLGLIALHEFGHWLMMKISGYKDMGRFFVPFVGPIDRGRKLHATPWQQLFVILAGPVPGMVAGMVILTTGFFVPGLPLWLLDLGGLAVALNAFHLLPFLPLDGGKVVDLLVFRDLPFIRPLFTLVSAVATLLASFVLKSRGIRVIAVGMFIGLIWDLKMIKVVRGGRKLGWAGSVDDEDEALRKIFRGVREEQNEAFLGSHDWQRQITVLLAEVLRKRPGFATRIFGGALYWTTSMLPVLMIAGVFALMFVGSTGQLNRLAKEIPALQEAFPREERTLTQSQYDTTLGLVTATHETSGETTGDRAGLAARIEPEIGAALDKLDWTAAGIAHRCAEVDTNSLSVWLEILCGKLEAATGDGRTDEALRRSELLLHGAAAMEPPLTLADRELLWDAQLRSLTCVEKLAASGKLNEATLQRLYARVNVLNKAPQPAVENMLLVGGWGKRQAEMMFAMKGDGTKPPIDARFWRQISPQMRRFSDNIRAFQNSTPATVALARYWTKTGRVGEIPKTPEEAVQPAPGEAEFITAFCESHRQMTWRRLTALSALNLEMYRQKAGNFPPLWKHSVPGGANMELVHEGGPVLQFTDRRAVLEARALPAWLGGTDLTSVPLDYRCPLFGGSR